MIIVFQNTEGETAQNMIIVRKTLHFQGCNQTGNFQPTIWWWYIYSSRGAPASSNGHRSECFSYNRALFGVLLGISKWSKGLKSSTSRMSHIFWVTIIKCSYNYPANSHVSYDAHQNEQHDRALLLPSFRPPGWRTSCQVARRSFCITYSISITLVRNLEWL